MSEIKNDGLDQHGARPFEQQQFGTADVERVNGEVRCPVAVWARETSRVPLVADRRCCRPEVAVTGSASV